jgi:hypothetical protein
MTAKASKEVIDRVRSGRHLLSAFEVEGPRVAASFLEDTRPYLEEDDAEPRPDGVLVAVERKLRGSMDHLVDTDRAVGEAEGRESVLRKLFREDKRELAFCLVAFRRLVLSQYVEPDLANLGLEPVNVRDGITVPHRGQLVGDRLEAPNVGKMLGKPRFEQPANLAPYVAEIRKKSAALLLLSDEINEAHRASDRARIARSRAKDVFDRVYLRAARIFEDLCRLSGLDDLAARVRRRQGRPEGSREEAAESPEVPSGQEDDGSLLAPREETVETRLTNPIASDGELGAAGAIGFEIGSSDSAIELVEEPLALCGRSGRRPDSEAALRVEFRESRGRQFLDQLVQADVPASCHLSQPLVVDQMFHAAPCSSKLTLA